jgi:uncharacterized protein RhaS with RHS repeats
MRAKLLKFVFFGSYYEKTYQREFHSQNTPFYNFYTTQPIHTNSNSIDAARQMEHHAKLSNQKFQSRGTILTKIPPKGVS